MARPNVLHFALLTLAWQHVGALSARTCSLPTVEFELRNCTVYAANQPVVQSWGVLLGVGGSTELCAMPSTVVNSTLLQSSEICSDKWLRVENANTTMTAAQCRSRRGGFVTAKDLPPASADGLDALNPGWVSLMDDDSLTTFQYATQATLQIRDESITMIEGLISEGQQHTTSHIGLGDKSVLLQSLKDAELIGAQSWGLNAGSQSYLLPRDGSLVLGGYDESSLGGPFFNYSISNPITLNNRYCPLQVSITGMTLKISNGNGSAPQSKVVYSVANKLPTCIEPYDNLFRLPSPFLNDIKGMLAQVSVNNSAPVGSSQYKSLFNLEPGLVYPSSAGTFSVSMEITINEGLTVTIPSHELVRPLRGLDENGMQAIDTRFNEVQVYGEPAPEEAPVLGKAFLSQVFRRIL